MQKKLGWIYEDKYPRYLEKWDEIKALLKEAPTPLEMLKMLDEIELPLKDFENMYSDEKINEAIAYGKELKDRYSVLWLYSEAL